MKELCEALFTGYAFESWLRFQFLEEKDEDAFLSVPSAWLEELANIDPLLLELLQKLNDRPIFFETSRNAILDYMKAVMEKAGEPACNLPENLESSSFQSLLEQYQAWLAANESLLPQMEFSRHMRLFRQWQEKQKDD